MRVLMLQSIAGDREHYDPNFEYDLPDDARTAAWLANGYCVRVEPAERETAMRAPARETAVRSRAKARP
jgi:hypothetical protein